MNLDSIEAKAKEQYPYTRQQDGEVHASLDGSNWWVYYGANTILEDTMFSSSAPPSAGSQAGDAALLAQRLRLNEFYDAPMLKRCIADIEAYAERLATEQAIAAMQQAKSRVLRRTEIPKDARNPTRDATVILGEHIADIIQGDIDTLSATLTGKADHE